MKPILIRLSGIIYAMLFAILLIITVSCSGDDDNPSKPDDKKDNNPPATDTGKVYISPASIDFGKVLLNQTGKVKVTIKNTKKTAVTATLVKSGADSAYFTLPVSTITIPPGDTNSFIIDFVPIAERAYNGVLNITADLQYTINLAGTGSTEMINLQIFPQSLDFQKVILKQTKSMKVNLQNLNPKDIFSLSPVITGPDAQVFRIKYQPSKPMKPGDIDSVVIEFSPDAIRKFNDTLIFDPKRKYIVVLTGEGYVTVDAEVNPSALNFGNVETATTKDLELTITNKTPSNLTINTQITGGFSVQSQPAGDLLPNVPAKIVVRLAPTEVRAYSGTLTITTSNSVIINVGLTGNGTGPSVLGLNSVLVGAGPNIDGDENDPAWSSATELSLTLSQVESTHPDKRTINASVKSVNDGTYIYFLVKVQDASRDDSPNQFVFNGGDPSLDANWTLNKNGQDGISFMFPITTNVTGDKPTDSFEKIGCGTACHTVKLFNNYEGGSFPGNGTIDIWYWKAGTTNPQDFADDYVAYGKDGAKFPEQKIGDPNGNPWGDPNFRPEGTGSLLPINVAGGNNNGLDKSRFIWDAVAETFDPSGNNPVTGKPWAKDDVIPGWKLVVQNNPFTERADIEAKGVYKNNSWVVEFKRKLNTDNTNGGDVVLSRGKDFPFSFAYFDKARYYAEFEYLNLKSLPRPGHWGTNPSVITLSIK